MESCCQGVDDFLALSFSLPHCHPFGWQWVSTPFPPLCLHMCLLSTLNRNHRDSLFFFCFHWGTLHIVAHVLLSLCLCRHPVSCPFLSVMNNYIRGLMRWEMTPNKQWCLAHWQLPGNLTHKEALSSWSKDLEWWKFCYSWILHIRIILYRGQVHTISLAGLYNYCISLHKMKRWRHTV